MALPSRLPALRDDIDIFASGPSALGTPSWRLYDRLRNRFFQIGEAEFQMLAHWTVDDPAQLLAAVAACMPMAPDAAHLELLLDFLHRHQLLARRTRAGTAALATLAPPPTPWGKWLLHNYLFFRMPLANPDRVYGWLTPRLEWLFRPAFWAVAALLGLAALGQVMLQLERFVSTFSYAFSIEGLLWIALALMLLKSAHEVGHGVAAKRQGLRVTRTGVALLVLWPVLYTDVNDIWKLADWRARLQVSVAGIATELLLAIVATWGWLTLPEGPLQSALFSIASTAWILSLAINLNPFMRFDGYYLLSDLLNYPNLQDDAFEAARTRLRGWIGLGRTAGARAALPLWALAGFGFATWIYRALLFLGIAYFVLVSFPTMLGVPLAAVEVGWFIVRPVWSEVALWRARRDQLSARSRRAWSLALAGLALAVLLPWSFRVDAPAFLQLDGRENLFAPASAQLRTLHVRNGQQVEAGQVLMQLESPELALRLALSQARIGEAKARLDRAATNSATFDQSEVLQRTLAERMVERDNVAAEIARLAVRAARPGTVRELPADLREKRWLRKNEALATLLPRSREARTQVIGYVSERDYRRVRIGAAASFFPDGDPLNVIRGTVSGIAAASSIGADERSLTSLAGGPLPAARGAAGERLHGAFYAVLVKVAPGSAAPARIQTGSVHIACSAYNPIIDRMRAWLAAINAMLAY